MKKLLSLLSILTITGTSIPTAIANSLSLNSEQNISLEAIPLEEETVEKIINFYNNLPIDKKRDILIKSNNYYKNLSEDKKEFLKLNQKIKLTNDENKDIIFFDNKIIKPIFPGGFSLPVQDSSSLTGDQIFEQVPEHLVKISRVTEQMLREALSSATMETLTKTLKVSLVFSITFYVLYMLKLFVDLVNPDDVVIDYAPTHDAGDDLKQYFVSYKDNCMDKFTVNEKLRTSLAKKNYFGIREIYQNPVNVNNTMKILAIKGYFVSRLNYRSNNDTETIAYAIVENFEKVINNFELLTDDYDDRLDIVTSKNLNCFKIEQ